MAGRQPGVLVVGASAAGLAAADGLREGGYEGSVTVLDDQLTPSYDRPMLSKGLLASRDDVQPSPLRSAEQLADRRIDVQPGHAAVGLDIDRRLLVTNYGEAMPWSHVVIATGARARPVLTTAGTALPTLRTVADLEALRSMVAAGKPMTIIGSGFIGLEVAAALRSRWVPVTLLRAGRRPLRHVLGDTLSDWLLGVHRHHGVHLPNQSRAVSVEVTQAGYDIELADGSRRNAEAVLAGVGAEPVTDWLEGAGVELGDGVWTDPTGRTNVPGVWAAGDVANAVEVRTGRRRRIEHWTHAIGQGRHVGLNVARVATAQGDAGNPLPFAAVPYLWTEQYGLKLHVLGERRPGDEDVVVEGDLESGDFVVVHGAGHELHSVTICGRIRALRTYKNLLRSGASMSEALGAAAPA